MINFATQLSTVIGQVVSKLPINEYAAIGATVSRISANAAMQNYIALPPDLGKLVGQLNNAVRKTLKALPLDAFPMLNKMADELTPGKVLDEVLNYATFIANDDQQLLRQYTDQRFRTNWRGGTDEQSSHSDQQRRGSCHRPSCIKPVLASIEGHRIRSVALNASAATPQRRRTETTAAM